MNYRPIISFREIKPCERELIKNAESILKELGFKFKASSPYLDDREWEIEFSDDYAKEMYIQFRDDADEDHSPVVIIDDILTDKIMTVDGDSAYFTESDVTEEMLDELQGEYSEDLKQAFGNISNEELENIKESIKNSTDMLLYDMFDTTDLSMEKQFLIQELSNISDDEEKTNSVIKSLLNYINDDHILDVVYSILDEQ